MRSTISNATPYPRLRHFILALLAVALSAAPAVSESSTPAGAGALATDFQQLEQSLMDAIAVHGVGAVARPLTTAGR